MSLLVESLGTILVHGALYLMPCVLKGSIMAPVVGFSSDLCPPRSSQCRMRPRRSHAVTA